MLFMTAQSSLEKIFLNAREFQPPYLRGSCLGGEDFAFQVVLKWDGWGGAKAEVQVESPLKEYIRLYRVGNVPCELPAYPDACDGDYLTTAPGLFPDPLFPLKEGEVEISGFSYTALWVEIAIPKGCPAGEYPVQVVVRCGEERQELPFVLQVTGADLPEQKLLYTQWFHGDCIAGQYGVPVYSEKHWELLRRYLQAAAEEGMNTALTPVLTPALDTEIGKERPCTQLLKVEKEGQGYRFDFSQVERFMAMARQCGITHFEISHLFTQWGAGFAPAVYAVEQGEKRRVFGWDTPAGSPEYRGFLSQFLPAFTAFLGEKGLKGQVIFHISDEPDEKNLPSYRQAEKIAGPYLKGFPICDALSDYRFYEMGLVKNPVAATDHIEPFLEHGVPGLWAYTCCAQNVDVGNRFLAMPSYRNRVLGMQLYKYRMAGFLHWGYNFWYTRNSRARINPYQVTDAGRAFPGGDAFSVYPGPEGPVKSLRMKVFHHALQDLRALDLLESLAGRKAAEDAVKGFEALTFANYPRSAQWLLETREQINRSIAGI